MIHYNKITLLEILQMQNYLNCGIYAVDLKGSTDASFKGIHPSIIIQEFAEPTFYYVIPLTTYTKEKWDKLRKFGCCRINSTNSIARIDKMQIRETIDIPKRYTQDGHFIIPTYEEIQNVLDKTKKYLDLSINKAKKEYLKFQSDYTLFSDDWNTYLTSNNTENTNFSVISNNPFILKYPLNLIKNLSHEDRINILKNDIFYFKIAYDKKEGFLTINLSKKP